jgi:hypothetical protein
MKAEEDPLHILDKDMMHWQMWMDSGNLDTGFKVDLKRQKTDFQRRGEEPQGKDRKGGKIDI